ncbi:MAG: M1 family metallopeptidase [Chitinophagales bacterium]|nr:M1 family metallopeptidase [Chitinophagales bacterium]
MKKTLPLLTLLVTLFISHAQTGNYWQQQTDYKIDVTLNDTLHELNGFITIDYKNNSPKTLTYIYFHLWPNAYKDQSTPLAKQLLENGKTTFYYSKPYEKGYIDKLDFKINAEVCKWDYSDATDEICKLTLNTPLKPGESVRIYTPFHVKLPSTFSRLGHIGQSYQITQWFPKPAVFDKYGWHPIPYLDQGEFYSEFGTFDVSITLPKNYVVGATGDLQNKEELKWMDSLSEKTKLIENYAPDMSFPASVKETKTLRYTQKNIHDFGWFADKRYHVLKGEVELPYSKNKVTTWALFTNNQADLWSKAPQYLHDAIYNYSQWIGEYPYQQVTAVDGALSAGGGMEYPNVTVIGEESSAFSLDQVITHEVGHNWFYGILGSNERDHGWMDEGINSYYEYRYTRTKYPNRLAIGNFPKGIAKSFDLLQYKNKYLMDLGYQFMARENRDEPIEQPSARFTEFNYGVSVYGKSMLIFDYLEAYLGTEKFDGIMKKYFETWKYKHPQPEDVRLLFETETGKDLSWFFDDLLKTKKKVDYKVSKLVIEGGNDQRYKNTKIKLINKGEISSPVSVSFISKDSSRTVWLEGFRKDTLVWVPGDLQYDRIQIDPLLQIPEINRKKNT